MKEFNTQYHCTACDGEFDTRGETATVTRCPYCRDTERLEVTALQSADCEIENIEDTDSSITPEQEEMALYERSVEQLGTQAVSELCIHALANLIDRLIEFRAVIRAEDCTGEDFKEQLIALNDARARVMVSMNQLEVIYGDCADAECEHLELIRESIEETAREAAEDQPQPRAVAANEE